MDVNLGTISSDDLGSDNNSPKTKSSNEYLRENVAKMLNEEKSFDFTLNVNGSEIKTHKFMLLGKYTSFQSY